MNSLSCYVIGILLFYIILLIIYIIVRINQQKVKESNNKDCLNKINNKFKIIAAIFCIGSMILGILFSIQTKQIRYIGEMFGLFPFYVVFIKSIYYDTYIGTAGSRALVLIIITILLLIITQLLRQCWMFINDIIIEYGIVVISICMLMSLLYLLAPLLPKLSKYKQDYIDVVYITYLSSYINWFIILIMFNISNEDSNTIISSIIILLSVVVNMFEKIDKITDYLTKTNIKIE